MKNGRVVAVSVSERKGTKKRKVPFVELKENFGIIGDAHAGSKRQISMLSIDSIEKMKIKGLELKPGDFAENITTEGINLLNLNVGSRLRLGGEVILEVTHKGKICHSKCSIYYAAGDCVMPREGIFAKVIKPGMVKQGDKITLTNDVEPNDVER